MQVWNLRHAARWKHRTQQSRQKSPSGHHRTTLSGYIFATKAHIDNRKKIVKQHMSSTCPHNVVNFDPLAAEIDPVVWGTPANFNGFRVLAALFYFILHVCRQLNVVTSEEIFNSLRSNIVARCVSVKTIDGRSFSKNRPLLKFFYRHLFG